MSFFRGLVERWNYVSNTVILEDRELTITLIEFRRLSGLPIFGAPYDEFLPREEDLKQGSSGSYTYSASLKKVFNIYSDISSFGDVTLRVWIQHFTYKVKQLCH